MATPTSRPGVVLFGPAITGLLLLLIFVWAATEGVKAVALESAPDWTPPPLSRVSRLRLAVFGLVAHRDRLQLDFSVERLPGEGIGWRPRTRTTDILSVSYWDRRGERIAKEDADFTHDFAFAYSDDILREDITVDLHPPAEAAWFAIEFGWGSGAIGPMLIRGLAKPAPVPARGQRGAR